MEIKETIEKASLKFYKGILEGKDIVLVRCGIGKVNSALCALSPVATLPFNTLFDFISFIEDSYAAFISFSSATNTELSILGIVPFGSPNAVVSTSYCIASVDNLGGTAEY